MKKSLILIVLIIIGGGAAAYFLLSGEEEDEPIDTGGVAIEVPLQIQGASNIGGLHVELVYDPDVLEATKVTPGQAAANGAIESNLGTPGRVVIGFIDAMGVDGNGTLATVSFSKAGPGETALSLENVEATDADTLYETYIQASDGSFSSEGNSVTAPILTFADR